MDLHWVKNWGHQWGQKKEPYWVNRMAPNSGLQSESCLDRHWDCCLESDLDPRWATGWGSGMALHWEHQRAGSWGMQTERSLGARKGTHLELRWGYHLVQMRG